jgi:hypothetical protein
MAGTTDIGSEPLEDEAAFLLSLTHNFSRSFSIKHERVRNWRLLGIVMSLENDGLIEAPKLRKLIKPLIPSKRSDDTLHPWLDHFVREFSNDQGHFLDRLRTSDLSDASSAMPKRKQTSQTNRRPRAENTKKFKLSTNFYECARAYTVGLTEEHTEFAEFRNTVITDKVARRVVKELFQFQTRDYWPLFQSLVADIADGARKQGRDASGINSDEFRLLHWAVILVSWSLASSKPHKQFDKFDLNLKVNQSMIVVNPDELGEAIDFLSTTGGSEILTASKDGRRGFRYSLNVEFQDIVEKYLRTTSQIRPRWRTSMRAALSK